MAYNLLIVITLCSVIALDTIFKTNSFVVAPLVRNFVMILLLFMSKEMVKYLRSKAQGWKVFRNSMKISPSSDPIGSSPLIPEPEPLPPSKIILHIQNFPYHNFLPLN